MPEEQERLTVGPNTYFIDVDDPYINSAEFVRLREQDRAITSSMPLFPVGFDPRGKRIIDIACGPGGWIRECIHQEPGIDEIWGIDNNKQVIGYAAKHVATRNNKRVSFALMNVLEPLDFEDEYFDYVNIRFVTGVLERDEKVWLKLIRECMRILKSGGTFRLTESEMSWMPNAEATNTMLYALMQVMWKRGKAFASWQLAVTPVLSHVLREAGLVDLQEQILSLDYSHGTDLHKLVIADTIHVMQVSRVGLVKLGGIPEEQFDTLFEQMCVETSRPDFKARWPIPTWTGRKPE